jgi:type IV secretory pathway TrbL component
VQLLDDRQASALVRGAAAGAVATVVMSGVMLAAHRAGRAGAEPRGRTASALAAVAHVGFGATTGALHALLPATDRPVRRAVLLAVGVYAGSYAGWVPALGALPTASRDRPDRQVVMAASHVVYGTVLGLLDDRWR